MIKLTIYAALGLLSTRETGVERGLIDACDVCDLPPASLARTHSRMGFLRSGVTLCPLFSVNSLFFRVASRDRIAPNCTIRHPVRQIVALQRRVRFSAQLAGFCRIRWHQRRARRAERASFSGFVSNPDFRVPSLRQRGERVLTGAVRQRKRGPPERPRIEAAATSA